VWWCGDWRALLLAVAFGLVVNLWLVARFLWPELLDRSLVTVGGLATAGFWLASVCYGFRTLRELRGPTDECGPGDLFLQAQREYLNRHWFEAENLLLRWLRKHDRDVDAHLLLATLYRHTRRIEEAQERLTRLERLDGAAKWAWELAQERKLLAGLEQEGSAEAPPRDEATG
jgi:hypothetical protein